MLAQTYTSTQAPTCRRLQPSLILQSLLEGSSDPLFLSPACTGRKLPLSCRRLQPLDPPNFFNFFIRLTSGLHYFFVDLPRDSSFLDLEILNLHQLHRCIIDPAFLENRVQSCRYLLSRFFFSLTTPPHAHL